MSCISMSSPRLPVVAKLLLFVLALPMAASAQQRGLDPQTFSKSFAPDIIGPGSVSTLQFTITDNTGSAVTDLAFTDTLPAGVAIADPANASTTCPFAMGGSLDAPDGGTTITFSGGQLGASQSCVVLVDVTSSTSGTHMNVSSQLTSSQGSSGPASDDLTVAANRPGFSKSFAPGTVSLGGRSTLTFTVDNSANANAPQNLDFTDVLPVGMVIASPANAATDCESAAIPAVLIATAGTGVVTLDADGSFSFPVLAAGATCTVSVDVTATGFGMLDNVSGELLADFDSSGKASATLDVTVTPLALSKSFVDDPTPPGGTAELRFTLSNLDRDFSAIGVSFTDDLGATLAGLTFDSLLANDCGGTVTGVGTTMLGLTGGTLAPEASCTLRVSLSVPAAATPGIYTNTTSAITGTVDGSPVTGNMASDDLFAVPVPILTKEFLEVGTLLPDPVINAGDDVVIRFTITNTSTTSGATEITFGDELTTFLPFPVTVGLPPSPDPPCGAGSSLALVSLDIDRQGLSLTGGSLAAAPGAGSTCTFDVTLTTPAGLAPGVKVNTTEEITATVDGAKRTGVAASDSFTVIAAPLLTKEFTDDPVAPGGTVTLELTLTYPPDAAGDASNITFTDDLAPVLAGLTANLPPSPDPPCGAGSSLTGSAGDTLLTLMNGTLMPGESCTFGVTLDVPVGAAGGSYTNTTSGVGATVMGLAATSIAASDVLRVAGLTFTKEFLGDPVIAGDTVTLRFTIANISPNPGDDATISSFTDTLNADLPGLAATGPASLDTCGGALSGTTSLLYVGGSVAVGQTCVIEVEVLVPAGAADDTYLNMTSDLVAMIGGVAVIIPAATDLLTVDSNLLQLTKQFTDDPVAPGGSVTLELTLTNLDGSQAASAIGFTDDLGAALAGLTSTSLLQNDCGGTVSGIGTDLITVTGAALVAGGSCTIRTSLTVPAGAAANTYANTTSAVTGTIGGFAVSGDAASDVLRVIQLLLFTKSFDGPTTATGTPVLTFTITNPTPNSVPDLSFSDDLTAVLPGLIATNLPLIDVCGAGSIVSGSSFLALTDGSLPPSGGTCTFDVDLVVPVTATAGTFPNTTSDLFDAGLAVGEPATADLTVEPPPLFAKSFAPNVVDVGQPSTLTFTIDNTASAVAAGALAFTDNLPAGMVAATPPNLVNGCGGTATAVAGSGAVSVSGGTVAAGATCTVQVVVTLTTNGTFVNITGDLTSSSGNSGTATDTLIGNLAFGPEVTQVTTGAGPLAVCDTLRAPTAHLRVTIADDASAIQGADDPASYLLVEAGPDGDFATTACGGGAAGNDVAVEIVSLSLAILDPVTVEADLRVGGTDGLVPGLYRFFVCDTVTDDIGNALDGDGDMTPGGDFTLSFFRADPFNRFDNGDFDDCPVSLAPWSALATAPNVVQPGVPAIDDVQGSPFSASAHVLSSAADPIFLAQCVAVEESAMYDLEARLRFNPSPGVFANFAGRCEFFDAAGCTGASLGLNSSLSLLEDEGGAWISLNRQVATPLGAVSASCDFAVEGVGGPDFSLFLDGLFLGREGTIFADGFESGNVSAWSASQP